MQSRFYRPVRSGERLPREKQLVWAIATLAAEDWDSDSEVDEMVGNRIVDNAGVAIAALNRRPVIAVRSQALPFTATSGGSL